MKEIILASNNKGKVKELKSILKDWNVKTAEDEGICINIKEDGNTFLENASKKARIIGSLLDGKWCMADDSGLEIESLDGFPGVKTKRWLEGTDRKRNLALLEKLKGKSKKERKAKFKVCIAVSNGGRIFHSESYIDGYIAESIRGENGFGFDEIFELDSGKTLAELKNEEKEKINPRKKALAKIIDEILK